MKKRSIFKMTIAVSLVSLACNNLAAQEVASYQYDAMGRLTRTTSSGGPSSQFDTRIEYDPAGNRVRYKVQTATVQPPNAVDDIVLDVRCWSSINILANDSDPDGRYPLTVVSFTTDVPDMSYGGEVVQFTPFPRVEEGEYTAQYTIENSMGLQASATVKFVAYNSLSCD